MMTRRVAAQLKKLYQLSNTFLTLNITRNIVLNITGNIAQNMEHYHRAASGCTKPETDVKSLILQNNILNWTL